MKIKFIGAIGRVTGSCSLLEHPAENLSFLIDCGMAQGEPSADAFNNNPWPFFPSRLDFVLLTHAHLDHCGLLPRLVREGFTGQIYCTKFTGELARLNLLSAAAMPGSIFTRVDVERLQFEYVDVSDVFEFDKAIPISKGLSAAFRTTSHIGGACSITIKWNDSNKESKEMVFSGDLGPNTESHGHQPLLVGRTPLPRSPQYVLVESTYGGRVREEVYGDANRRLEEWKRIISRAMESPTSSIVVPSFSIHRCQELLIDIHAALDLHLQDEIVIIGPLFGSDDHCWQALKSGINVTKIERSGALNPMAHWTESRRSDFFKYFEKKKISDPSGKVRSVYLPIASADAPSVEAIQLLREMRACRKKKQILVIVDSTLAQSATAIYRKELKRRLNDGSDTLMYRNPGLAKLLGVDSEADVDALLDQILLGNTPDQTAFATYNLKFCKPEDTEAAMKGSELTIILSSSGMCDVGPIVGHLARELPIDSSTIVLTGYADPSTLGGKLREVSRSQPGQATGSLKVGKEVIEAADVRAKIEDLGGFYSGHADSVGLLDFLFKRAIAHEVPQPKCRVFINHGDDKKRLALSDLITSRASKRVVGDCAVEGVEIPGRNSGWFDLDRGEWLEHEPVSQHDETQSMLLRLLVEQRRTNDLLSEMLKMQRLQMRSQHSK